MTWRVIVAPAASLLFVESWRPNFLSSARLVVGGLAMPLLWGMTTALAFSEAFLLFDVLALNDALSLPGMVEELVRAWAAPPTALYCDEDYFISFIYLLIFPVTVK